MRAHTAAFRSVAFEESEGTHFRIAEPPEHSYAYALMTCQHCLHTSMFVYRFVVPHGYYHEIIDDVYCKISDYDIDLGAPQVYPASVDAPDHLPDKAKAALHRSGQEHGRLSLRCGYAVPQGTGGKPTG